MEWFSNNTDNRDDEWHCVSAYSPEEAKKIAIQNFGRNNFSASRVFTIQEFRKQYKGYL